jgi:hypothetical protein
MSGLSEPLGDVRISFRSPVVSPRMRITALGLGFLLNFLLIGMAAAAVADDPQQHRPANVEEGEHEHAHPPVDLPHAIVTESPVPETELTFRYSFGKNSGDDGSSHGLQASIEYAFNVGFSVEAALPYALLDPDSAGPRGGLDNIEIAAKWATYQFTDYHLLPSAGVAVSLPTGDDERGIGSDRAFEIEPFVRVGYWMDRFHAVGEVRIAVPFNRRSDERKEGEDFSIGYNLALFYEVTPHIQALVELHGDSAFGGIGGDSATLYVSPGVTFLPFKDESVLLGVGVSLPITDERDFDYAVNLLAIIHL